jgi:hypothetical protein
MKMFKSSNQALILASMVATATAFNGLADQAKLVAVPGRSYSGRVTFVDPLNRTFDVKSWTLSKKEFNLGDNCSFVLAGVNNGTLGDLRPGQEITVHYQDLQGVRIADRVEQHPMRYEGMVNAVDPNKHTLSLREGGFNRSIRIADGCVVTLRQDKSGVLADIQPGDHVTVTYETPNGDPVARQISQTSMEFTGQLTAIDLDQRVMKAKGSFETKEFSMAGNCAIVINGRIDGKLSQLNPDEKLTFNYDTVNGVNVVSRIAPATGEQKGMATTSPDYTPGF